MRRHCANREPVPINVKLVKKGGGTTDQRKIKSYHLGGYREIVPLVMKQEEKI